MAMFTFIPYQSQEWFKYAQRLFRHATTLNRIRLLYAAELYAEQKKYVSI